MFSRSSASGFGRSLSEAAPGLTRRFFSCHGSNKPLNHMRCFSTKRVPQPWSRDRGLPDRSIGTLSDAAASRIWTANATRSGCSSPLTQGRISAARSYPSSSKSPTGQSPRCTRPFSVSTKSRTQAAPFQEESPAQSEGPKSGKKGFYPEHSTNVVAYWLLASAASVFGIVIFGGLTRLTESGYVFFVLNVLNGFPCETGEVERL